MCAIFGLIDYNHTLNAKQREKLLRVLSEECEERGTDATGYAFNHNDKLIIYKRPYAAHKVHLRLHDDSNVVMGHTRMATQGNKLDNRNNHPFSGKVGNTNFALAHNGVLHNDVRLRKQMSLPNTPVKTDSYIAVQLLEQQKINTRCGDILKIDSTGAMEQGMFDTTNLMMYDYRYFRRDWWNVPESCASEPQDVKQLKDFASSIGVSREDIDLLLSYGYFVEEIEEMLYEPSVIEEALCEILDECAYDYCGEF